MRYRINGFTRSLTVGLGLIVLSACQSPPEDKTSAAREALERAREAGAAEYSTEEFQEAQRKLEAAQAEIDQQDNEWSFSRDYAEAERLLEEALASAEQVAEMASTRKEQASSDAEEVSTQAQQAIEEARLALESAPRGKGSRADVAALESDLRAAESTFAEAQRELRSESFLTALEKFRRARESATQVSAQVEQAGGRRR
jgi:hypothetical protein